jgi:hypothetical protein
VRDVHGGKGSTIATAIAEALSWRWHIGPNTKLLDVSTTRKRRMDKTGKIPHPKTKHEALIEIRKISLDKRGHVLLEDHCAWLELKLKVIGILAYRGLRNEMDK